MKTSLVLILLSFLAAPVMRAEDIPQALIVEAPAEWEVKYKSKKNLQFYTVTRRDGDKHLLMFSKWPVEGNIKQIPDLVKQLAENFLARASKNKDIKLKSEEYEIEKIEGDDLSGSFVLFSQEDGSTSVLFMIGDKKGIWNGQFTGSSERWTEALTILKNLKVKG